MLLRYRSVGNGLFVYNVSLLMEHNFPKLKVPIIFCISRYDLYAFMSPVVNKSSATNVTMK